MHEITSSNCKYHPKKSAGWFCSGCKTYFCNECAPVNENYPKCILCRRTLNSLSISEIIQPFGQKLISLFLMPFSKTTVIVIFLSAMVLSVLPHNKIGLLMLFVYLLPLVEFLFASMEQVACGEKLSIRKESYFSLSNTNMFLKLLVVCFMTVFMVLKIHNYSPLIAQLMTVYFIIGFPASLVILMMEKSMIAMINPLKIGYIIKLFSFSYWIIFGCVIALFFLLSQIDYQQLAFVQALIISFFSLYLTLTIFLMAGYLVFQYHFELNYKIDHQSINNQTALTSNNNMSDIEVFIQEGRFEDAQTLLLDKINSNKLDYKANEKLILLYAIQDKGYLLNIIAQKYFSNLVEADKNKHAADFYCLLQKRAIQFAPENIKVTIAISTEMLNKNQFKYAIKLLELFIKNETLEDGWEQLYFIYSKLLAEFASRQQEAIKCLTKIMQNSSNKDALKNAAEYLKIIE